MSATAEDLVRLIDDPATLTEAAILWRQIRERRIAKELEADTDTLAYSPSKAAEVAGVGRSTVYDAIADGWLKARKLGSRTLVLRTDLEDWLTSLPVREPT